MGAMFTTSVVVFIQMGGMAVVANDVPHDTSLLQSSDGSIDTLFATTVIPPIWMKTTTLVVNITPMYVILVGKVDTCCCLSLGEPTGHV